MTTGKPWTTEELATICRVYAEMLYFELNGEKYNKAQNRRDTLPQLDGRSAGSYEMKCCNISAALRDAGLPYIKGYKPLKGYQKVLKTTAAAAVREVCSDCFPLTVQVVGWCTECYSDLTHDTQPCACFPALPTFHAVDWEN